MYNPKTIARITIKPDPAEIPNKKGPANPFLNKDCNKAPDVPNADPTSIDAIVRGNLTCQSIIPFISLPLPNSYINNSVIPISLRLPADSDKKILTSARNKRKKFFFIFQHYYLFWQSKERG